MTHCYSILIMKKNIVGENIRRIREELHITQEELALRCDLTQSYINVLENGKRGYSRTSLEKVARALGVKISELFEERKKEALVKVSEQFEAYGNKRRRLYEEIIALLDKLPDIVVNHYKTILSAEVAIRNKEL